MKQLSRHESELSFRNLFGNIPVPTYIADVETFGFLDVNDAALRQYGYTRDEFLSLTLKDLRPPEELPRLFQFFKEVDFQKLVSYHAGEWVHRRKDSSKVTVDICSQTVDFGGRQALLIVAYDISERKRVEDELIAAEERFRLLSDVAFEAIVIHQEFIIKEVNRAFLEMLGFSTPAEVVGRDVMELVVASYREMSSARVRARLEPYYEMEMLRKNQSHVMVGVQARTIRYGNGFARVAAIQDISRWKNIEHMLREREARLRILVEQMPAILWTTDENLRITSSLGAALKHLGVQPNEFIGMRLQDLLETTDLEYIPLASHLSAMKGESVGYEAVFRGRSYQVHIEPFKNESGKFTGVIGVALDSTDRKASEEKLRELTAELSRSNKELEQFAFAASHDLQEPLRMVASFLKLISNRYEGKLDKDMDDYIHFAVDGAVRMKRLIDDLLSYSRVGRQELRRDRVDCNELIERIRHTISDTIQESGANVLAASLPSVWGDRTQLELLFQNLVSNAIKFRKPETSPAVKITGQKRKNDWVFSVEDNGIGFDMEYADYVFQLFKRLHTREEYSGTGIGLSICKRIVESHGGKIWAESRKGEGSKFFFTLPDTVGSKASPHFLHNSPSK